VEEHEVYAIVGHEGFERLVSAFYQQVPAMICWVRCIRRRIFQARNNGFGTSSSIALEGRPCTSRSAAIPGCGCGTLRFLSGSLRAIAGFN